MASVLIATDDAALAHILSCEIEGMGFVVLWELDGYAANLAAVERQPRAVLLDANLRIHTGLELAALLRADPDIPRELPIVLLSDDDFDPHLLEKAGITRVFPKEHDGAALREILVDAVLALPGMP